MVSAAYNGSRCEVDENNCLESTQCGNDGMCKDLHLDFECLCRTTDVYTGRRFVSSSCNSSSSYSFPLFSSHIGSPV